MTWLRGLARGQGPYLLAVAGQLGLSAFNFLLGFLAIRLLRPGDLGLYSIWGEIATVAVGLQSALVLMPLTVHVPAAEAAERRLLVHGLALVNAAYSAAVLAAVALTVLLFRAEWIPGDAPTRAAAAAAVATALLREYPRQDAFGAGRVRAATLMDAIHLGVAASSLGLLLLLLPAWPGRTLFAILAAISGGAAAAGAAGLVLVRRRGAAPGRAHGLGAYRRVLPEVRWATAGGFATAMQDRAYVMLLTALAGVQAVGVVFAGGFLLRASAVLSLAWSRVARPRMARFVATQDVAALDRTLWTGVGALMAQHLALSAAILLLWRWVEPLLGRYEGLHLVTLCWIAATTFAQFRAALSAALQAAKDFRFLAWTTVASTTVTLPATLATIFAFGWRTSVLGMAAGEAVAGAAMLWRWRRVRGRLAALQAPAEAAAVEDAAA